MKNQIFFILIVCIVSAVVAVLPRSEEDYQNLYIKFLKQHNRVYEARETLQRFQIFKSNLDYVEAHNERAAKGQHSFLLAINRFGDWTNQEYRQRMLGLRRSRTHSTDIDNYHNTHDTHNTHTHHSTRTTVPASIDWRTMNAVTPIKDQGQCGSCWAFSATAAMEGAWSQFGKPAALLSLSEQLCVDCVNGGADTCDMGGEMHDCYLQVIQEGGDESEDDYPYTASSGYPCNFDPSKVVATFSSYQNVTQFDEKALQQASAMGVISIGIDASQMSFQFYYTGVYDEPNCKSGWYELDHGVAIVGYDSLKGKDYWTVKNSWGEDWGMSGYILMSRNKKNQCGVATDATFPII